MATVGRGARSSEHHRGSTIEPSVDLRASQSTHLGATHLDAADLPTVHSHLDHALRHLEVARALTVGVADDERFTADERFALNADAAEAGLLIDRLTRAIAGPTLDRELARLMHIVD